MATPTKPMYRANPAHNQRSAHSRKTPEPADAWLVYEKALPGPPIAGKLGVNWYGLGANGQIYRFSDSSDHTAHFSGMTNYAPMPLRFEDIPIEIRRALGRLR